MKKKYLQIIKGAIQELNNSKGEEDKIGLAPNTVLLGTDSAIESIDLINMIVAIEEKVKTEYGQSIVLVNEHSMSSPNHPFQTISSLATYLGEILSESKSE